MASLEKEDAGVGTLKSMESHTREMGSHGSKRLFSHGSHALMPLPKNGVRAILLTIKDAKKSKFAEIADVQNVVDCLYDDRLERLVSIYK